MTTVLVVEEESAAFAPPEAMDMTQMELEEKGKMTEKQVVFFGAQYIEYDAEKPVVVRLCGVGRTLHKDQQSLMLEYQARGIEESPNENGTVSIEAMLTREYVKELHEFLRLRGVTPMSEELEQLQKQAHMVEILLTLTTLHTGVDSDMQKTFTNWMTRTMSPEVLMRLQLAKKELIGRVDEGYVFGRRFYSIPTYVDTLERDELVEILENRSLTIPEIDEKEKSAIKIADRQLLAKYSTGAGRALKQLTLRELVTEAHARGVDIEDARDSAGKKSKRAWIDTLRPILHEEHMQEIILEKQEVLLRTMVCQILEEEMMREQKQQIRRIIDDFIHRYQPSVTDPVNEPPIQSPDVEMIQMDKVQDGDKWEELLQICFGHLDTVQHATTA